jgi:outer membrane receptor protein involved in Fe transport
MCKRAGIIVLAIFAGVLSLSSSASLAESASAARAEIKSRFDLPAEPMDKALRDFALQANCNISYEPSLVAGLQAPAIKGEFTVDGALALILTGTKLRAVNVNEDTIQILEKPKATSRDAPSATDQYSYGGDIQRVAIAAPDAQAPSGTSLTLQADSSTGNAKRHDDKDLEEITVTGTHIRGTKDSPSPVLVFSRADIDATGMISVQQFLQTLPQNFGGASENTINSIAAKSRTNNTVDGSAPNLRGLGAEATLVLINGHRVAPGNSDGSFVDISMIPLAAVERIEMVTDGASAIYGSDAVGGVVNIILRSKFDGAESRALFGAVGTGSMHNVQAAQTVGDTWSTGSALLSYQYSDQTPLSAGSRDYLHSVLLPFNLLPEEVQHAAFANIDQAIEPGFDLHGDAMYSHRSTNSVFSDNAGIYGDFFTSVPSRIDAYSASLGSTVALPRQSKLAILVTYSESDTSQQEFQTPPADAPLAFVAKTKSALASLDVNVDGVLAALPGGSVRYAIGAQYRRESFGDTHLFPPTDNTFYPTRNVGAGYVELRVPVVGPSSGGPGDPVLELTVADRAEHYSDFGATNNPQMGAIWKPITGVAIRSTYGTSFKAPTLSDLNPVPAQVIPYPGAIFNPAPGGTPNTLIVDGGNPDLKPEKATVWTVGLDFKPLEVPGLTAKLTYYDIVFKNEINAAQTSVSPFDAFVDEAILGPEIVQRNPPNSLVQQYISAPTYVNPFNINPATIGAIFDDRELNLSTAKTRGLDFGVGYKTSLLSSSIDTGIDGTHIFAFDDQFTNNAPIASFLNAPYNPIDLRLRGRAVVTRGPLSMGLFLNFTNSYTDTNVVPNGHVSSWTTADAVVSYEIGSEAGPFSGASIALGVVNLTDRDPPYVTNYAGFPINYDGVNANPLGRFFSLRLQKRW